MTNNNAKKNPTSAEVKEVLDQAEELQKDALKTVPAQSVKEGQDNVADEVESEHGEKAKSDLSARMKSVAQKINENKKAIVGLGLAVSMLVVAFTKFNSKTSVVEEPEDTEENSDVETGE